MRLELARKQPQSHEPLRGNRRGMKMEVRAIPGLKSETWGTPVRAEFSPQIFRLRIRAIPGLKRETWGTPVRAEFSPQIFRPRIRAIPGLKRETWGTPVRAEFSPLTDQLFDGFHIEDTF